MLTDSNANMFLTRCDAVRCDGSYMSKMDGCCGEVKLAKNDSYKKWGIEIRVRFRSVEDQGKMAVLDKRVHSGGERSVSTILYLMALQVTVFVIFDGGGKHARRTEVIEGPFVA